MKVGDKLKRSGKPHDGRAPDYDDWQLNGDLIFWYEPLKQKIEISSMGIRVSPESLHAQLKRLIALNAKSWNFTGCCLTGNCLIPLVAVLDNHGYVCFCWAKLTLEKFKPAFGRMT